MTVDEALKITDVTCAKGSSPDVLATEVRRLQTELEQERKRLDWALSHDAAYYKWDGVWQFCCTTDSGNDHFLHSSNPRATIDELMEN